MVTAIVNKAMTDTVTNIVATSNNPAIVLLAAGSSSRLGQPKQLVEINGEPLIVRQAKLALAASGNVLVVLGCNAEQYLPLLATLPITIVVNERWETGMGSSIATGVNAIAERALCAANTRCSSVLLLLVDQWQLELNDLNLLINRHRQQPTHIVVSQWLSAGQTASFGPPAIFPQSFFTKLIGLTGRQGAKAIIAEHKAQTIFVNLANAEADLDTPEQLANLLGCDKSKQSYENINSN